MQDRVAAYLQREALLSPGSSVVVGLSGGPDSVCLLHVLHALQTKLSFRLFAAHLHHGIRAEEADGDLSFVKVLCADRNIPFYYEYADVPGYAEEHGMGLEEAGRELRYTFLRRAKEHFQADRIAVAHHRDDQAESILLHLLRGCGLEGLQGMQSRRGDLIRPLLFLRRAQILDYLKKEGLSFRQDSTNALLDTPRNRIRLELLPYLEAHFNPNLVNGLAAMGELLTEDAAYLERECERKEAELFRDGSYPRPALLALPPALRSRLIRRAFQRAGVRQDLTKKHVEQVTALLSADTGRRLRILDVDVWNAYERIYFGQYPKEIPAFSLSFPVPGSTDCPLGRFEASLLTKGEKPLYSPNTAYLDADLLPAALVLRSRQPGDRFYPLGAPGERKLKEVFIDRKIPRDKRQLPLLAEANSPKILFVPGLGIAAPYKLSLSTQRILRVVYHPYTENELGGIHGSENRSAPRY